MRTRRVYQLKEDMFQHELITCQHSGRRATENKHSNRNPSMTYHQRE